MEFLSDILIKAGLVVEGNTSLGGVSTAVTPSLGDNSTKIATTAFIKGQGYLDGSSNLDWNKVVNRPTDLAGYGITNAYTKTEIAQFFAGTVAITGYNKSNWDEAYNHMLQWNGGSEGLSVETARATLELGSMALENTTSYYTQLQLNAFFSGATTITGYNKSNWDTAFGWGNHAAAGYLTTISGIAAGGELEGTYANPTLKNSAVIGKLLTGLNIAGGSVAATDSILTAFGKVQNQINSLLGGVTWVDFWNASTNTPTIPSAVGNKGKYYIVQVAGSTNIDGETDWKVGDWIISNGVTWGKVDNTDAVVSVNGFTGAVSLTTSNIAEGTELYFNNTRARAALSFTAGSGAYNASTGVITIPTDNNQIGNSAGYITSSALSPYYTAVQIQNFFSGASAMTGYNKSNWDTAFGWGNWAASSHYIGTTIIANNRVSGAQTLTGVSIDGNAGTATLAANSTLLQGYSAVVASTANTVALRDGNGYLRAVYFYDDNTSVASSGITSMYGGTGDRYIYKFNQTSVRVFLGLGSMAYESSGSFVAKSGDTMTGSLNMSYLTPIHWGVSPYRFSIQRTSAGLLPVYIDDEYDSIASSVIFRMRTAGTPVTAITILGTGRTGFGVVPNNAQLEVAASSGEVFRADAASGAARIVANQTGVILGGTVTSTGIISAPSYQTTNTTTSPNSFLWQNSGGQFYIGQEGSVAGAYYTGSAAYDNVLYSSNSIHFIISGAKRLTVSTTGLNTTGSITSSGAVNAAGVNVSSGSNVSIAQGDIQFISDAGYGILSANSNRAISISNAVVSINYNLNATTSTFSGLIQQTNQNTINTTTPGTTTYGIHFNGQSTADYATGITWNGGSSGAQAGIYVQGSGSYGTRMYIATTDNYTTGSKTAISIDQSGLVNFVRATPTVQGNIIYHAGNFTPGSYLPLAGGTLTGPLVLTNANITLSNAYFLAGRLVAGTAITLIGRNTSNQVSIDPDGYSTVFGGNIVGTNARLGGTITSGVTSSANTNLGNNYLDFQNNGSYVAGTIYASGLNFHNGGGVVASISSSGDITSRAITLTDGYGVNIGNFQIGAISANRLYIYNNTLGIDNITIAPSTGITTFARAITGTSATFSLGASATSNVTPLILTNTSDGGVGISFRNAVSSNLAGIYAHVASAGAGTDDGSLVFGTSSNGVYATALTLASNQAATFSSTVTAGGTITASNLYSAGNLSVGSSNLTAATAYIQSNSGSIPVMRVQATSTEELWNGRNSVGSITSTITSAGAATFSSSVTAGGNFFASSGNGLLVGGFTFGATSANKAFIYNSNYGNNPIEVDYNNNRTQIRGLDVVGTIIASSTINSGAITSSGGFLSNQAAVNAFILGSNGSNYGQIFASSSTTWALGYGASSTTIGTSVLTWGSSGVVSTSGSLTVNGSSVVESLSVNGNMALTGTANRYVQIGSSSNYYWRLKSVGDNFQINMGADALTAVQFVYPTGAASFASSITAVGAIGVSGTASYIYASGTGSYIYTTGTGSHLRAGLYTWMGGSGGDYGSVGYNVGYTTTSSSYTYAVSDKASFIRFNAGGFEFWTAPSGSAGAAMSPTLRASITEAGVANFNGTNIQIGLDAFYAGTYNTVGFGGLTNGNNRIFASSTGADGIYIASATSRGIVFRVNGGAVDNITINSSGNMIISTTTASTSYTTGALVVSGGVGITGAVYTNSSITAAGNITAYSDVRLKENIFTIDNALDKVLKMRGVYFNRRDIIGGKRETGVVAQEIEIVLPEVVHNSGTYLSVGYGNIVGVLIEAIKELKAELNDLKNN